MLRAEVYARALRASHNRKEDSVQRAGSIILPPLWSGNCSWNNFETGLKSFLRLFLHWREHAVVRWDYYEFSQAIQKKSNSFPNKYVAPSAWKLLPVRGSLAFAFACLSLSQSSSVVVLRAERLRAERGVQNDQRFFLQRFESIKAFLRFLFCS